MKKILKKLSDLFWQMLLKTSSFIAGVQGFFERQEMLAEGYKFDKQTGAITSPTLEEMEIGFKRKVKMGRLVIWYFFILLIIVVLATIISNWK
jgi:hypothetical protein